MHVDVLVQAFTFSAYGTMVALHNATATNIAVSNRLSSLGYSGETFDAASQQQYLRARYYNPTNGRFNRLDPFAGNNQDPQSLNKYVYVHGDPIQGTDPTGLMRLISIMTTITIGVSLVNGVATAANAARAKQSAAFGFVNGSIGGGDC